MRTTLTFGAVLLACVALLAPMGCTQATKGAGIGGALGALAGGVIGHQSGNTAAGAAIGAAVGGGGGYMLGNEMDKGDAQNQRDANAANAAAGLQAANTQIINITNSNGSITPVTIRRQGNVWVGPKNEIYNALPTVEQLKPIYGF